MPDVASQVSGSNLASMRMGTALLMTLATSAAAYSKTITLCCPTVLPILPPTGREGVGSFKPSFASSLLLRVIVVAITDIGMPTRARSRTTMLVRLFFLLVIIAMNARFFDLLFGDFFWQWLHNIGDYSVVVVIYDGDHD